jgi:hypothetical protein
VQVVTDPCASEVHRALYVESLQVKVAVHFEFPDISSKVALLRLAALTGSVRHRENLQGRSSATETVLVKPVPPCREQRVVLGRVASLACRQKVRSEVGAAA